MIRPASLKDIPYLLEIEKFSFLPGDRFSRYQFWYAIRKGKGILLVDSEFATIYRGYIYILNTGRIYSLAVHPAYRNEKVAQKLLKYAEEASVECRINPGKPLKLTLEVRKDNRPAFCFYSKNGYIYGGIRQNYYADGTDAIIMKKDFKNAKR